MNTVRLMLFLIVTIVSIVNIVIYYRNKGKMKKNSRGRRRELKAVRSLSAEERDALAALSGRDLERPLSVYSISGGYSGSTLTVRGSSSEVVHAIGGIVVDLDASAESCLSENNEGEIVDPDHKKGALVLSLNGYSAVEESKIRRSLARGTSFARGKEDRAEEMSFRAGPPLDEASRLRIIPDYRLLRTLCFSALLGGSFFPSVPMVRCALLAAAAMVFVLLLFPERKKVISAAARQYRKKQIILSGRLRRKGGAWRVDRFDLVIPSVWEERLQRDKHYEIKGYPMGAEGRQLTVTEMHDFKGRRLHLADTPPRRRDRWTALSAALGIITFLVLTAGGLPSKGRVARQYLTAGDLPSLFEDYNDLISFELKPGQFIQIRQIPSLPVYDDDFALFLVPDFPLESPDFSALRERMDMIENLQRTEEFLLLRSLNLADYYSFLADHYYGIEDRETLADKSSPYDGYFRDSPAYGRIRETAAILLNLPEDVIWSEEAVYEPGGALDSLERARSWTLEELYKKSGGILYDFFEEQRALVVGGHREVMGAYMRSLEHTKILGKESSVAFRPDPEDFMVFSPNRYGYIGHSEYFYNDPIRAAEALEEFQRERERLSVTAAVTGIVIETGRIDGEKYIRIDEGANYDSLPADALTLGSSLVIFLLFVLSLGKLILSRTPE